jgi:hypothetical protein
VSESSLDPIRVAQPEGLLVHMGWVPMPAFRFDEWSGLFLVRRVRTGGDKPVSWPLPDSACIEVGLRRVLAIA